MNRILRSAFYLLFMLALSACGAGSSTGGSFGATPSGGSPATGTTATPAPGSSTPAGGTTSAPTPKATATATAAATAAPSATTPAGSTTSSTAAIVPSFPMPLGHSGRWLTAADGRVVIFHGLNVAYKNPPYTPQAQGFTQADAAMLAREGFSNVRLWIWWQAFEPTPGVWDDSTLAQTKQFIGWLQQYGITVRLNFAQVIWGNEFGGIGFPDWEANTDGLPLMNVGGDVEDGIVEPSLHAAWTHLYNNDAYPDSMGIQDHIGRAWQHVAAYFKGTPGITAYDIVNEPEGGNVQTDCDQPAGCPLFDEDELTPFFAHVTAAIRQVDQTTMIDYEPLVLDATGLFQTYVGGGSDPNLSLTFHYYPQTDDALTTTAPLAYKMFENDAANHNSAIELTEFGATDDLTQIEDILDAADSEMLPWNYWAFYSTEPTGNPATPNEEVLNPQEGIVYDPTMPPAEANLKTAKLDVLGRPYPFLIAGTPTSWHFDVTTRTFTLTYSTKPVGGGATLATPTIVIVPVRLFPNGYNATATGGVIYSQPNANALTVLNVSTAQTVTITVTPK